MDLPLGRTSGNEFIASVCPGCGGTDKFWYNLSKKKGYCYKCKLKCRGDEAFQRLFNGELKHTLKFKQLTHHSMLELPGAWSENAWDQEDIQQWLIGRGLEEEDARGIPLWWVPEERAITTLVDPISPEFAPAVLYRRGCDEGRWMPLPGKPTNTHLWGWERWKASGRSGLLLVEGIFDLLGPRLWGYGVAMLGTRLFRTQAIALRQSRAWVLLFLDPDEGGREGTKNICQILTGWGIPHAVWAGDADEPKHFREWEERRANLRWILEQETIPHGHPWIAGGPALTRF